VMRFADLCRPPLIAWQSIGMVLEACGSSHHWGPRMGRPVAPASAIRSLRSVSGRAP
jgi:hypothetical protein